MAVEFQALGRAGGGGGIGRLQMSRLHFIWYPGESDDDSCTSQMPASGWSLVQPRIGKSPGKPLPDLAALN